MRRLHANACLYSYPINPRNPRLKRRALRDNDS